ncbi:MAG: hypothetical protein WBR15_09760 [Gammaproteobacteria bacterium]
MIYTFVICQFLVVLFIAAHDWLPLGRLNNLDGIRAADTTAKLVLVTVLSTLPFAIAFVASLYYAKSNFPMWLMWLLWCTYGAALYGMLQTWWVPYLFVRNPARVARYQVRFANTHSFLPVRNGIRPDTLHMGFHAVLVATVVLLCVLSFRGHAHLM